MKGFWHIVALSASLAAISIILSFNLFIVLFIWLGFLYWDRRISIPTFLLSITAFLFFLHYIPPIETEFSPTANASDIIQGRIIESPIIQMNKVEIILELDFSSEKVIVLYFPEEREELQDAVYSLRHGASCIIQGETERPEGARNPGEFDYQEFLLSKGITSQVILKKLSEIECEGATFWQRFFFLRHQLIGETQQAVSDYTAAWVNALVLGDDSLIDDSVITLFQDWGLSHILAISGLHIGIVVGLVYFLLIKTAVLTKEKAELVVLLFLPFYAIIAGGEPSVLRACMMVVLFILLNRMKIIISATDVISVVFLLLLLSDRFIIYHIGFQFSFMVTFAIILSRKWLTLVSPVYQLLIISFISQMAILPIQMNYFSLFQPLSILLNLVVVPYFSVFVIPFMFFLLLFSFLPSTFLHAFDMLFVGIHHAVIQSIEWVDRLFNYPLLVTDLPVWFFILYYFALLLGLFYLERKLLKKAFLCFFLLSVLLIGYAAIPYFSSEGKVTMFDIGQGDAFVIELPYRKGVIAIDAGAKFSFEDMEPSPSVYQRIIRPYLRTNGIHQIDALFLTHEDLDHMGSVRYMLEEEIVKEIYVSEFYEIEDGVLQLAEEKDIPIYRITSGEVISFHEQLFSVLSPLRDKQKTNENSLVLYSEIGGRNWLFTGDISKEEEREIIERYNLQVDVIKVAHHGSNTSSDPMFLESIGSNIAFISVGENNAYGHPANEVIQTLEELGIRIYRADQHGAVQYIFNEEQGYFETFLPN